MSKLFQEVKLSSPDLDSGLSMSKTDSLLSGLREYILVGHGLNEKFDLSYQIDVSSAPDSIKHMIDLKTSLEVASHVTLGLEGIRKVNLG